MEMFQCIRRRESVCGAKSVKEDVEEKSVAV